MLFTAFICFPLLSPKPSPIFSQVHLGDCGPCDLPVPGDCLLLRVLSGKYHQSIASPMVIKYILVMVKLLTSCPWGLPSAQSVARKAPPAYCLPHGNQVHLGNNETADLPVPGDCLLLGALPGKHCQPIASPMVIRYILVTVGLLTFLSLGTAFCSERCPVSTASLLPPPW
jgi:hypothetical protein